MKAEILMSLTAAQGVPLDGKGATPMELAEAAKWFRHGGNGQDGSVRWSGPSKSSRSYRASAWSLSECAFACRGLPERSYLALRYRYALDDTALQPLRQLLIAFAERRQHIERWPPKVETLGGPAPYVGRLVDMALVEERQPWRFVGSSDESRGRPRNLRVILMGVTLPTWHKRLAPKYEAIRGEFEQWVGDGAARMQNALREDNTSND
jgi:hypothetical protein